MLQLQRNFDALYLPEYLTVCTVQISRKNIAFLDVRDINSEALVELFVDLRAGEQSILRRVFGLFLSLFCTNARN